MANDLQQAENQFFSGLSKIYRLSNIGANAESMTIDQLQSVVRGIYEGHNTAREAWNDLVSWKGADEARVLLGERIDVVPINVPATLVAVRTAVVAILDAYTSQYGNAVTEPFSYTIDGNGVFQGGFTYASLGQGVLNQVNSLSVALRTVVMDLHPIG